MEFTESEKVLILSLLQEPTYTAKPEAMIARSIALKLCDVPLKARIESN